MYCFTESLLSRRVLRPNFFTSIYLLFSNKIMFLLSKVVGTNLFIQYCLTFSRNSHKCIYRIEDGRENETQVTTKSGGYLCILNSSNVSSNRKVNIHKIYKTTLDLKEIMSQSEDSYRTGEGVFRCLSILRNLKLRKIDNSVLI